MSKETSRSGKCGWMKELGDATFTGVGPRFCSPERGNPRREPDGDGFEDFRLCKESALSREANGGARLRERVRSAALVTRISAGCGGELMRLATLLLKDSRRSRDEPLLRKLLLDRSHSRLEVLRRLNAAFGS